MVHQDVQHVVDFDSAGVRFAGDALGPLSLARLVGTRWLAVRSRA